MSAIYQFSNLPFNIPYISKRALNTNEVISQHHSPMEAAYYGNLIQLQQLLDEHYDFDTSYSNGLRPLHYAASQGQLSAVQFLIEKCEVTVDAIDYNGETALLKAACSGHFEVVKYLILHADANIFQQDKDGWSALHNSCSYGHLEMVQFLLSNSVDVNIKSRMDHTPLINAATKGHLNLVQHLVYKANADPFCKNKFGETAFCAAAVSGEASICEELEKAERLWNEQHQLGSNYDILKEHSTVPVIIFENQQSVLSLSGLTHTTYIPTNINNSDNNNTILGPWSLPSGKSITKNTVTLPPINTNENQVWTWLTDWMIDYTLFDIDEEGWQYAKNFDADMKSWRKKPPTTGIKCVRRRRWVRIMTRRNYDYFSLTSATSTSTRTAGLNQSSSEDLTSDDSSTQSVDTSTLDDNNMNDNNANNNISENDLNNSNETHEPYLINDYIYRQEQASRPTSSTSVARSEASFIRGVNHIIEHPHQLQQQLFNSNLSNNNNNFDDDHNSNSNSSRPSIDLIVPQSRSGITRVWEKNEYALDCRQCRRWFNFINRKHHCRQCGLVVCDKCSMKRVRLPYSGIIHDPQLPVDQHYKLSLQPQRVCDVCYHELAQPTSRMASSTSMERSSSRDSLMEHCPVCGLHLDDVGPTTESQENHVQACLNAGLSSSSLTGSSYVLYQAPSNSTLLGSECVICFEEFAEGDTIARLRCLCSYHHTCIREWFSLGKGCPIHSQ
ncbi:unnamed protein product [Cunninghamella blakesleeana]